MTRLMRRDSVCAYLGEEFFAPLALLEASHPRAFRQSRGLDWCLFYDPHTGTISLPSNPDVTPRLSKISIFVARDSGKFQNDEFMRAKDWSHIISVPIKFLRQSPKNYHLYNVSFGFTDTTSCPFNEESSKHLAVGYYGITGRHFLKRFREHASDANKGKGHLLHRVWHEMISRGYDFVPLVRFAGSADTLDEIYDAEERAVRDTLMPHGLNVIPGGREGIRFLHALRGDGAGAIVTPEDRDRALSEIESGKKSSHYRSGHIRNLPSGKATWVRPCWVNLPDGIPQ